MGEDIGLGSPDKYTNDFTTVDAIFKQLIKSGVMPYLCYAYTPRALWEKGTTDGRFMPPTDYARWKDICYAIAEHYRDLGWPMTAECWNEPDLSFWTGTFEEYLTLYDYFSRGVREADRDAKIGGPSFAFVQQVEQKGQVKQFLDYVTKNNLPLDVYTYHQYGTQLYRKDVETVTNYLRYGKGFSAVEMHITEFSVTAPDPAISGLWKPEITSAAAKVPFMWEAIEYFMETPQVTTVSWASFGITQRLNMTGFPRDDKRYAPYHALSIFNNMPVERVAMSAGRPVKGFASANETKAGAVLYTTENKSFPVTVDLSGLPFETGDIRVYAIDAERSNYIITGKSDELECIYEQKGVPTPGLAWAGELAPLGTLYIEITKTGAAESPGGAWTLTEDNKAIAGGVATVTNKYFWFPERGKKLFAEFDLATFTAYAGMGDAKKGTGAGGVLLQNLPDRLTVTMDSWGLSEKPSGSAGRFFKVDYRGADGTPSLSVLYTGGGEVPELPWTPVKAGKTVTLEDKKEFTLNFSEDAPAGWNGQIVVSYGITDYGEGATVRFRLR
jgi:hypothetical protein